MVIKFFLAMFAFVEANPVMVAFVMAIVEYVKKVVSTLSWFKPWFMTVFGFALGFAFAIPEAGFAGIDWFVFAAQGLSLGLVATGLYDVFSTLAKKVRGG